MNEPCRLRQGERYGTCADDVEWTADHPVSADAQPVVLRRHPRFDRGFDGFKNCHRHFSFRFPDKFLCHLNIRRKSLRPEKSGSCARKQKSPPEFLQ